MREVADAIAILCYGFPLNEKGGVAEDGCISWLRKDPPKSGKKDDGDDDDDPQMYFEEYLAKLVGVEEPGGPCDKERYETDLTYRETWDSYERRKGTLEEEIGVTLVEYNSKKRTMYILAAQPSVQETSSEDLIELGDSIIVPREWRENIHAFCRKAGIPFQEPRLLLCSYLELE